MISVMVLLYVCPMDMSESRGMAIAGDHSSCENPSGADGAFSINRLSQAGDCFGFRLALVGETIKNLTSTVGSFYLLAVLSVLIFYFFAQISSVTQATSLLVRLKRLYRQYHTSINYLTEIKIRQYLILLGNFTIVLA